MIDRVERVVRAVARAVDRGRWTARLLGLARDEGDPARPGLLIVQIDGLSRRRLERAVADGHMPFVRRLLAEEAYRVVPVYSGLPSTTPAVQAELFYGRPVAVPAFAFVDHVSGRAFRMYEREAVTTVERGFTERSALQGGASYCNVYAGHAATARFCMATLGPGDLVRTNRPLALPAVIVTHVGDALWAGVLAARELLVALVDLPRARRAGQDLRAEVKFVQTRVFVGVLLREALTALASVDLARGLPVVYLNLVGYDEVAHRRGPDSAIAMRSLRPIDRAIARLARAARRSHHRDYEVWVLSDHGQEVTEPYVEVHGRAVQDAVAEVFRAAGMEAQHIVEPLQGEQQQRVRLLGERLLGLVVPGLDIVTRFREPGRVFTTAQGSVGHVYAPRPLTATERHELATTLVRDAGVPLVLAADGPGRALAWTGDGCVILPDQIACLLGPDHPSATAVAEDLVALCHHPDAGDLVLSGWRRGPVSVSFPHEHGAHSGPGPDETDAFVVAPQDTPFPRPDDRPLRFAEVRATILGLRDGTLRRPLHAAPPPRQGTFRLVTYNVHRCVGLDGRLSPERIARVIARTSPDVVALQELDVGRQRTGGVDQAAEIAERLGMLLEFHPTITVDEEQFGDAVLSRLPMRHVRSGGLPGLPGRPDLEPRGALWVHVEVAGTPVQVITTHLSIDWRERARQVAALLGPDWLGHPDLTGPAVLCGDFNALPWFPACRALHRRLPDVQASLHGHRPRTTWGGRFPLWRIDHVFADPSLRPVLVTVPRSTLSRVASDHLPLVVDLEVPGPTATG